MPTVAEAGGPALKGYEASSWFGLLAPAGTPPDIVNRIQQEVAKSLGTPAIKERLRGAGRHPERQHAGRVRAAASTPRRKKWAQVVKAVGRESGLSRVSVCAATPRQADQTMRGEPTQPS